MNEFASKVNPEEVDPQMRNNSKLSQLLKDFEDVWCKGNEHLLNPKHRNHLITFSNLLENVQKKYPQFNTMVDNCDA